MGIWSSIRNHFGFSHRDLPDEGQAPSTDELATRRSRQVAQLTKWLPNPDKILRDTGKHIEHLRELLYDDTVFVGVQYLYGALRQHEWEIQHEGQEAQVDQVTEWLKKLDWARLDYEILQARLFGYQPMEITWEEDGGRWMPHDVKAKPCEWFAFNNQNDLKLRGNLYSTNNLQDLPPGKFLMARNKPSYKNPYGQSVLSRCFWPATFKKGDIRFLMTFVEKYGMDWAVGKHPRGESKEKINELLDMLENMIQDAVAAIPDDSSIELKESDKVGSSDVYLSVSRFFEQKIDKVLVGSELVTSSGEHGTHALGKAQIDKVSGVVTNDLATLKEDTMDQLLQLIWRYNGFPDPVPTFNCYLQDEAGKEHAERDEALTRAGVRFTKEYWQREYNLDEDEFEVQDPEAQTSGPQGPAQLAHRGPPALFQQGGQAEVESLIERLASQDERNQKLMEDLLEEPMRMVRNGDNPQQVMQALAARFPELDASQLEERLRSLFFAAEMWGRLSEEDDDTLNE